MKFLLNLIPSRKTPGTPERKLGVMNLNHHFLNILSFRKLTKIYTKGKPILTCEKFVTIFLAWKVLRILVVFYGLRPN